MWRLHFVLSCTKQNSICGLLCYIQKNSYLRKWKSLFLTSYKWRRGEPIASTQVEANNQENEHEEPVVGRKRKKTLVVWNDFDEMEISPGWRKLFADTAKVNLLLVELGQVLPIWKDIPKVAFKRRLKQLMKVDNPPFHSWC